MDNTWIKLYRKTLHNGIIQKDPTAYILFSVILLSVDRETGEMETGRFQLSHLANIKPNTIYKILSRLSKKWQMVTLESNNKYTKIKVKNWAKYQQIEKPVTQSDNNKVTTKEQQSNTIQEIRNKNNTSPKGEEGKALTLPNTPNPLITDFVNILKEHNQSQELDGTQVKNRYAAKRVIEKIKKEFRARTENEPTEEAVKTSLKAILQKADDFHQKNLTNFDYLDKHFYKIIKSSANRGIVKI